MAISLTFGRINGRETSIFPGCSRTFILLSIRIASVSLVTGFGGTASGVWNNVFLFLPCHSGGSFEDLLLVLFPFRLERGMHDSYI